MQLVHEGYIALTFGAWFENDTTPVSERQRTFSDLPISGRRTAAPGYALELTEKGDAYLRSIGIGLPTGENSSPGQP